MKGAAVGTNFHVGAAAAPAYSWAWPLLQRTSLWRIKRHAQPKLKRRNQGSGPRATTLVGRSDHQAREKRCSQPEKRVSRPSLTLISDVPGALALDRLCAAAAHELLMRSYTHRTLNRYKRVWERLTEFAHVQGCANEYSMDLALRFEQAFGIREGEQLKKGEGWRLHLVFSLKVLDDFARTGSIARFSVETTGLRIPLGMHKPLREYEQYARERRHLRRTSLADRMHCIALFLDFLRSRGLDSLGRLQADDISAFFQSRSIWKPKTVSREVSHLRQFLQFLFMRDIVPAFRWRSSATSSGTWT